MSFSIENLFLFPVSVLIATVAMASGIGGAVFFSPIFLLWLHLEPSVAIGTALLTELFGFSSGLIAYLRLRRIDFRLAVNLLLFSISGAALGVWLADEFPPAVLKGIFAVGLIFIGYQIFTSWRQEDKNLLDEEIIGQDEGVSRLIDRNGKVYRYTVCRKAMGRTFAAVGGFFLGMISVGLAELQEYHLVAKCRVPSPVAVATSIFVVVCTVSIAVAGHGYTFMNSGSSDELAKVVNVAIFTVPGVLIGGQVGPKIGGLLNPDVLKVAIAVLFMLVGAIMLITLTP